MISICMPYYMRQDALARSLLAYRQLYRGLDYEIVICDDGSPEPVVAPGCKVVRLPQKDHALNPCVPINYAVAASEGDVIVLTNPEVEHRTPVLEAMREALEPGSYVTASCLDVDTRKWLAREGVVNGEMPVPDRGQFHFCAMLDRFTWNLCGGFDERYRDGQACDDTDWLWKLHSHSVPFIHCNDLIVYHRSSVRCRWPQGGLERNKQRLMKKWNLSV